MASLLLSLLAQSTLSNLDSVCLKKKNQKNTTTNGMIYGIIPSKSEV